MIGKSKLFILLVVAIAVTYYASIECIIFPVGIFAYATSGENYLRFFWWIWPVFWTCIVFTLFFGTNHSEPSTRYIKPIFCLSYLLLARVITLVPAIILIMNSQIDLPVINGSSAAIDLRQLIPSKVIGFNATLQSILLLSGVLNIIAQWLILRRFYNSPKLIWFVILMALIEQVIAIQINPLIITLALPVLILTITVIQFALNMVLHNQ